MKKIILLILLSTIIFCGCDFATDHENAVIFFSPQPITAESFDANKVQNTFDCGQPIYFCIYSKTPFNSNEGLIQMFKKNPDTRIYGYTLEQGKDILLNPAKNSYTDSFAIYTEGYYLIKFFSQNNFDEPLAQNTFYVSQ